MPTLLINRVDIKVYRQVSDTVYDEVLNEHINDAQFEDTQRLLGSDFYNDLIRNYTDLNYVALLDGGDYTYQGVTYTNVGLKAVIVQYFYSRYVMFGSQTDTPFGYVEKLTPDSQGVDIANKRSKSKSAKNSAFNYWENVKLFLDRNQDDYPLWKQNCTTHNKSRFKVYKVNGRSSRGGSIAERFKYNN